MGKQFGSVQRRIRRAFLADPDGTFHTIDLATWCYPKLKDIPEHHRWTIVRAAKRVAVRLGRDRRGVIFGAKKP